MFGKEKGLGPSFADYSRPWQGLVLSSEVICYVL